MKKYPIFIAVILTVSIFSFILLFPNKKVAQTQYDVGATIFPIYDITKNIAGDALNVGLVLPLGASPHTFEPSPSLVKNFTNTKVIYAVGAGFDDWIDPIINSSKAEKQYVSSGIGLRTMEEDGETVIDPHYWLTVANAKIIATSITNNLSRRYPAYKLTFENNLDKYLSELDTADNLVREKLLNLQNKNLITLHDAYYYFADEYSLNIVGTFEPTAGREPTAQYLIELTQGIQRAGVNTIYSEPQLSVTQITAFTKDNNLAILELDPIGGTEGRNSFIDLILYNASQIKKNK
ncbi:hypothetical protein COY25_01025 [Candidatus Uhrbacteria bacterium CG_4_10_14_0_2_um_filter_41_7]|uniref:Zinc ABC transporter substrate-binding protein n=1 Tax=Candidatus Uhrbacteria bacterium CG_4_9_14_3_um_filter_41_35 TaxID=1975034 RepID=A0A2M7XDX3_9BACT|nr:MAG: hypothetical protein COV92_00390 [Candidatus Uhrbacteria bacterium CG11_big_fil_rev_8_21_14_0_20_41_9]PIZ55397.1 MAG: hypothetical protein COY25_01025 [Candidatus Uhrbacteria bacterium CG_4_10_14_0_2_um_filter_41_7]PJA46069.1 MAG: hypothetical protein CO173_03780 [Candidatus Uhrbacteria bacterium CG_4_9_14_3_um_filter_41_35]